MAYYFCSLAIGLMAGIAQDPDWLVPTMVPAVLVALFIADHPRLYPTNRHHNLLLPQVFATEADLEAEVARVVNGTVHRMRVKKVDLRANTTSVDIRYRSNG